MYAGVLDKSKNTKGHKVTMIKKILKKLEIIIIFLLSYISIYSQTNCKGFDANDFVFNGKASVTGSNEVTLTPDSNNVYGTLWSQQKYCFPKILQLMPICF